MKPGPQENHEIFLGGKQSNRLFVFQFPSV